MFIGLVYLFGAPTHVYFALWNPDGYRGMSDWAPPITSLSRDFWLSWFLPNARYLGLLIAVVEVAVAVLILSRGHGTRLGFGAATLFHVAARRAVRHVAVHHPDDPRSGVHDPLRLSRRTHR
jgi:hypothetical protein